MPKPKKEKSDTKTFGTSHFNTEEPEKTDAKKEVRKKPFKKALLVLFIVVFIFLGIFLTSCALGKTDLKHYLSAAASFLLTPPSSIKFSDSRTNVLILGKGGDGHTAPDLTDTILLASVYHDKPSVSLISFPRDIWIAPLRAKLNSAYYWGNRDDGGDGGLALAKATVESISGQPVHYGVVIDFSAFKEVVDVLEGVEVEVETAFTDAKYPIAGRENDECEGDREYKCRYETISFEEGKQIMDGETALKFVRSRNAEGDEGTDIARGKRQQKVLAAIKDETLSAKTILNPVKVLAIFKIAGESLETDVSLDAGAVLARRLVQSAKRVKSFLLPEELFLNPPISPRYDNLYVFVPKSQTWEEVQLWISSMLNED